MILCYKLSMPNVGSWNGKWTGADRLYAIVKNYGKSQRAIQKSKQILDKGYFHHNFGDGWSAGIHVSEVNANESRKIRRLSKGFCGYDWMIDSIENNLRILA